MGDVAMVGAAAAAEHIDVRQPVDQSDIVVGEFGRIAVVELGCLVKFDMAHARVVGSDAIDET